MGTLIYDSVEPPITIDDRTLSHLKVVILSKLRRGESFSVSWRHGDAPDAGRSTIWVNQSIPLRFIFDETEAPELNQAWLSALAQSANELGGIHLSPEEVGGGELTTPARA
ncbi:hypothetical protein [Microbacterium marinilacus]|uniref:DUF7882 domain-containing protein n=1 Tax=Microbacterium marinilacus TaxID=415209 RepID=A0ABP7BDD0_9MICO|nr:hypothetical protein [Microbacterium marinilacus]MBY0689009.1 hypothetical protein [Microbacterium marinilacus]